MRALRIARLSLLISLLVYAGSLALGLSEPDGWVDFTFLIALVSMVAMVATALACVIIQAVQAFRKRPNSS
ncbi:MAG TPA: hypothetical protein VFW19_11175 [Allosphingosinicella sp.]|nr:hypothetical protein [Allosphingosinicella sp.]